MSAPQKNYLGNGWERTFNNGGSIINLSVKIEELKKLPVDKYGCVKITVSKMRDVNEKTKATHTVYENDYVPGNRQPEQEPNI